MNNNSDVLELVTNLRLSLHPSNHSSGVGRSNDELGVGANAASKADMIFLANDSLSELVWSPHKGLSVRCAVAADKRSSFFWPPGSSADMVLSSPHDSGTQNNLENLAQDRISVPSPTASNDGRSLTAAVQSGQARQSGSSESMNTNTVAVHEAKQANSPDGNLHAGSAEDKIECVAENDLKPSDRFPQDSAINVHKSSDDETLQFRLDACEISKAAPITALASSTKGKERILSDDNLKKEASQDNEDDSYESVESSNSARKFPSKKKRMMSFNEQLIVKSKRLKMQVQETPVSSSLTRNNSSFANWISAMVKGSLALPSTGNENKALDSSSREQDKTSDSMGFQSLFQSIYQPSTRKVQDQRLLCNTNYQSEGSNPVKSNSDDLLALKEYNTKKSLSQFVPGGATQDASAKKDDHLNSLFVAHFCPKSTRPAMSYAQQNAAGSSSVVRRSQHNIGWFEDSKNAQLQGSSSEEPTNSSSFRKKQNFAHNAEVSCTVKEVEAQNMNQIVHFQRLQSSEAMASVFAKRLDALKNIMPTDLTDKLGSSSVRTCFFCGVVGHDLKYCPQLTESEVEELVRNMSAYGGKEESPCLCIRCFQLNHWAAACPNVPTPKKKELEVSPHFEWRKKGFFRDLSLPDVIDRQSQALRVMTGQGSSHGPHNSPGIRTGFHVSLEMKQNAESIEKVPPNLEKLSKAISEENSTEFQWFPYPCGSLPVPRGIFEAVKSLQLSRTDIMKWINSIFSISLDGYYLRLRHKSGEGLGRTTQYHVARIISPLEGKSAESSKRPIHVAVGGIRCSVETQYISNQDFHEDELKEWWSATLKGDHGNIPSEDELRSKVEERRRLDL
ncbi:hypothetical protein V2J09_023194 [Rumex salicifolius]